MSKILFNFPNAYNLVFVFSHSFLKVVFVIHYDIDKENKHIPDEEQVLISVLYHRKIYRVPFRPNFENFYLKGMMKRKNKNVKIQEKTKQGGREETQ